jgi:tRNA threonylcarbamoyladenosine biosynthesis protein TsaB
MSESTLILGVDTATSSGGVCLLRGMTILAAISGEPKSSHSNTLLRDIAAVLEESRVLLPDIDCFAAASGPGSFTGLRIGLATVKALSATLNRPVIGIPSLHAVARAAGASPATVALIPAGRGELFAQLLSVSPTGEVTEIDRPLHLPPAGVIQRYSTLTQILWAGPGAQAQAKFLRTEAKKLTEQGSGERNWLLAKDAVDLAIEVAALAQQRLQVGEDGSPALLRALYVRPSDPELKECPQAN